MVGCWCEVSPVAGPSVAGWFCGSSVDVTAGGARVDVVVPGEPAGDSASSSASLSSPGGRVRVLLVAGGSSVVECVAPPSFPYRVEGEWLAEMGVALLCEGAAAQRARDELASQMRAHGEFLDRLAADAREYADDNDLCSVFDDFMELWGFARRERVYEVGVRLGVVSVRVLAGSEEDARDRVDWSVVRDALSGSVEWSVEGCAPV